MEQQAEFMQKNRLFEKRRKTYKGKKKPTASKTRISKFSDNPLEKILAQGQDQKLLNEQEKLYLEYAEALNDFQKHIRNKRKREEVIEKSELNDEYSDQEEKEQVDKDEEITKLLEEMMSEVDPQRLKRCKFSFTCPFCAGPYYDWTVHEKACKSKEKCMLKSHDPRLKTESLFKVDFQSKTPWIREVSYGLPDVFDVSVENIYCLCGKNITEQPNAFEISMEGRGCSSCNSKYKHIREVQKENKYSKLFKKTYKDWRDEAAVWVDMLK